MDQENVTRVDFVKRGKQWRSSVPKSRGGHKLFFQKSEKQKKKKKKSHSGVKAQDRVL